MALPVGTVASVARLNAPYEPTGLRVPSPAAVPRTQLRIDPTAIAIRQNNDGRATGKIEITASRLVGLLRNQRRDFDDLAEVCCLRYDPVATGRQNLSTIANRSLRFIGF